MHVRQPEGVTRQNSPNLGTIPKPNSEITCSHNHIFLPLLQENCFKSPEQIEILGVCRGYDRLPADVQKKTEDTQYVQYDSFSDADQLLE